MSVEFRAVKAAVCHGFGEPLVVEDIDLVRATMAGRGVDITEVQQLGPERQPGSRSAFFNDPDGNEWLLQEIKTWLPGREWEA